MWLYERRSLLTLLAGLPVLAAGCGFSPALAPGGAAHALRGRIRMRTPRDSAEFALVAALEERLGRPQDARYLLDYDITTGSDTSAVTRRLGATRQVLTGRLDYSVTDTTTDGEMTQGTVRSFTGWSLTTDPLSERVARADAETRLMRILADQIAAQILASADDWAIPA